MLTAALGSTFNLSLLGVGSFASAVLAATNGAFLGALGLLLSAVAYGAVVGMDITNEKFLSRVLGAPDSPRQLASQRNRVDPTTLASPELVRCLTAVEAAHGRVSRQVEEMGGLFTESLVEIAVRASALVEDAGQMAERSGLLIKYLDETSDAALERQVADLEARAAKTRDAEAAAGFRKAADARRGQADTRQEITALVDRIQAQLLLIETSLDEMQGRLVKMRAQDADDVERIGRSMVDRLASLRQDVGVLESSIQDISASVSGASA